jgi:F-type H+-transporting ATPase subunit c
MSDNFRSWIEPYAVKVARTVLWGDPVVRPGSISSGLVFGSLIEATARNPSLRPQLFSYAILGFALAEATGLFCLMMAFLLLYSA